MAPLLTILLLVSCLFPQDLITDPTELYLIKKEIHSLKSNKIQEELFLSPFVQKKPARNNPLNLIEYLDLKELFKIEPIGSFRLSTSNFEMFPENSSALWLTPGLKLKSTIPIVNDLSSIWLYSWAEFHKHSAIFANSPMSIFPYKLFEYNPDYSMGFYTGSVGPNEGIDFDQSQAGVSILSNNFEFVFGKFNTSFGPFTRGNLSLSNNAPPIEQIFIKLKHKKIIFSYLLGSLDSNIPKDANFPEDELYIDLWELDGFDIDLLDGNQLEGIRLPSYERYVAYHRLDFNIRNNIRIGAYEQIIFGGRDVPTAYMIPVLPFWSSQHETGDLDNLMIGLDFDILFGKKINIKNRLYGSVLIDEWAPYSAFDRDDRNWFAYQLGYSRNGKILNKDLLYKMEYTRIGPRVYNHRFIINEPKHHGYNIGFWSGNHSDDFLMNLVMVLDSDRYIKLAYEFTRFSNADLSEQIADLENQYNNNYNLNFLGHGYNYRGKISLTFSTLVKYGFFLDFELSSFNTKGLYSNGEFVEINQFEDMTVKIRYNISK